MADSKKYDGSQWEHSLRKLTTATEAVENPLYSDGTAITAYTLKGNTVQNGTPTPSNPVPVVGVGELETTGEHTGEYKIPILNGVTTNIDLGSTQTVRAIGKRVYDGTENWALHGGLSNVFWIDDYQDGYVDNTVSNFALSSEYVQRQYNAVASLSNGQFVYGTPSGSSTKRILIKNTNCATKEDWIAYLQTQYAAGTPVTVWYVLATATTGIVNEPLMKIGDYVDTLSNAVAIPTTEGANSITVDTTVQPSEFTATWTGWHDSSVKEYDGTNWQ